MTVFGKNQNLAWFLLLLVSALTVAAYWPGVYGPFIFDDLGNLDKLGALGGVDNWPTFKAFVFGGNAGPSGRPISLMSFVLNAQNWPAEAFYFKLTNLIIHLVNGLLIFSICIQVQESFKHAERKLIVLVSATTAGIWLIHPFLVSTTLYVVQRMTQLAALFCFMGISGYLYGRSLQLVRPVKAYIIMSVSVGVGTILAVFSKENGALLPMLILVLEFTVFAYYSERETKLHRIWKLLFLLTPSILISGYLLRLAINADMFKEIPARGFSLYERLLTEGRILVDYQAHWFFPRLYTAGVFQDAYQKSTGIFQPISTIWALAFHGSVLLFLVLIRKRWAILSFAGLFFYSSHLVESTTVSLELYFEHRNYIGTAFLILPLVLMLYKYLSASLAILVSLLVFLLLAMMTFNTSKVWSNYDSMVLSWAQSAPNSSRAQQQASMQMYNRGEIAQAIKITENAIDNNPKAFDLYLWQLVVKCKSDRVLPSDIRAIKALAVESKYDLRTVEYYKTLLATVSQRGCSNLSLSEAFSIVSALLRQPINGNPQSAEYAQIQYFLGMIKVHQDDVALAVPHFNKSLSARSSPDRVMNMAAFLATEGFYTQALDYAEIARRDLLNGNLGNSGRDQQEYLHEIGEFERVVRGDILNGQNQK